MRRPDVVNRWLRPEERVIHLYLLTSRFDGRSLRFHALRLGVAAVLLGVGALLWFSPALLRNAWVGAVIASGSCLCLLAWSLRELIRGPESQVLVVSDQRVFVAFEHWATGVVGREIKEVGFLDSGPRTRAVVIRAPYRDEAGAIHSQWAIGVQGCASEIATSIARQFTPGRPASQLTVDGSNSPSGKQAL